MASMLRPLGRLMPKSTALFVCDVQEKFVPVIAGMPAVIDTSKRMVRAAHALEIPVLVTEQYPKALGATVPELKALLPPAAPILPKTNFSMFVPEAEQWLLQHATKQVLLLGIEAHVCVLQTALDLIERGLEVHILADGVSSQRLGDRAAALTRLTQAGAFVSSSEMALFQLMRDAKHPGFKAVSALCKEARPEQLPPVMSAL